MISKQCHACGQLELFLEGDVVPLVVGDQDITDGQGKADSVAKLFASLHRIDRNNHGGPGARYLVEVHARLVDDSGRSARLAGEIKQKHFSLAQ